MGRIKTQQVKRNVKALLAVNPEGFTTNFEKNKQLVGEKAEIYSKKLRNIIAGSVTKHVKAEQE